MLVRVIDNLILTEQNFTSGTVHAHRPTDADGRIAQVRAVAEGFPHAKLKGLPSDFSKAYKQVANIPRQIRKTVLSQWEPVNLQIVFFLTLCQVFGSGDSPLNFTRYPAFVLKQLQCFSLWQRLTAWTTWLLSIGPRLKMWHTSVGWSL